MGIKGFESYLLANHPKTCPRVKIKDLVDDYRRDTGQAEAVAIIDTNILLRQCLKDTDTVCGGQFAEYRQNIMDYVHRLEMIGISPVFFLDGAIEDGKRRCWLSRKDETLRRITRVYQSVDEGATANPIERESCVLPAGLYECAILALKEGGYEVFCASAECDIEIAQYARRNQCFGIFSRDTDFVVLRGARHYLSLFYKHFRSSDMTTLWFDREAIAAALGLHPDHLPLLASLLRNDYVDADYLMPLYSKLLGRRREELVPQRYDLRYLVPAMVHLVRTELWKADDPVQVILDRTFGGYPPFRLKALAKLLGLKDQFEMRERLGAQLQVSLTLYEYQAGPGVPRIVSPQPQLDSDVDQDVLELARARHQDTRFLGSSLLTLLCRRCLEMGPALEDPLLPPSCGSAAALRPFRRRIFGLLQVPGPFKEWVVPSAPPDQPYDGPVSLEAICPDPVAVAHPGLLALWGGGEELADDQWRLFAWALGAHRAPGAPVDGLAATLRGLPLHLVMPVSALYLLFHSGALDGLPGDAGDLVRSLARTCLLATLHSADELRALPVLPYDRLSVHLGALFMRTTTYISTLNDVLGAPIPLVELQPALYFDGKLWQHVLNGIPLDSSKVSELENMEKIFTKIIIEEEVVASVEE